MESNLLQGLGENDEPFCAAIGQLDPAFALIDGEIGAKFQLARQRQSFVEGAPGQS